MSASGRFLLQKTVIYPRRPTAVPEEQKFHGNFLNSRGDTSVLHLKIANRPLGVFDVVVGTFVSLSPLTPRP
jgi:hypothetical protein